MGAIGTTINPRKMWPFVVECEGLETAYAQKVKIPKIEVKSAKHGDGPFTINTASRVDFGQLELEVLKPAESSATWWRDWLALVINMNDGSMGVPDVYKKTVFIVEYAADGLTIVDTTELDGVYPADFDVSELDKLADGNQIDKLKFNVDRVIPSAQGGF
jgi:hypothetical protein